MATRSARRPRRPEIPKEVTKILNIRGVSLAVLKRLKELSGRHDLKYGPYLDRVTRLHEQLEDDARKPGAIGRDARERLARAGFPTDPDE